MRNNEYSKFLCDLVWEAEPNILERELDDKLELRLIHQLHNIEFFSLIPNDDNRGMDGLELRDDFVDNHSGGQHALPFGPCSVLEMLIGLSFRLEFETSQSKWEKTFTQWFWILIDNLDLDYHTNKSLSKAEYQDKIITNVTIFLERRYKSSGEGGLFPLINPRKDQKKVEVWYQMSAYILENYPI